MFSCPNKSGETNWKRWKRTCLLKEQFGIIIFEFRSFDLEAGVILQEKTIIVDGAGAKEIIKDRVNQIKSQLAETTSDFDREVKKLIEAQ